MSTVHAGQGCDPLAHISPRGHRKSEVKRMEKEWNVYHGGPLKGLGRWSGPHRTHAEACEEQEKCRNVAGGNPIVRLGE